MHAGTDATDADDEGLLSVFGAPLLDALDGDSDRQAARALALLADADPDLVGPLAGRLLERLPAATDREPLVRTLATLADDHTDAVRAALDARDVDRSIRAAIAEADGWAVAERADGGTDVAGAVRRVVETDAPRPTGPAVVEREGTTDPGREADADRAAEREHRGDPAAVDRRDRIERAENSRAFRAIDMLSAFEDLSVVEPEQAVRYGSVLRTRARLEGDVLGVALRLFDLPDDADDRREFAARVAESLAQWDAVVDHDGVAAVHDWGDYPRPWVATPFLDGSLADRGRPSPERGLREAAHLAGAVAHCHRNGVVHGGLDPKSVVYPERSFDGLPAPRLDNVGLMGPVRDVFEPSSYLDPRYAAPEYFSREYGAVDAASDVYALGTVCFRLLTGRPPVTGDYETVRESVLHDEVPNPTAVNPRLPDAVDHVVAKATATDKLTRYETAAAVRRDCWRLVQSLD
ncbi:serine/threonine protein kinase [Halomicroarcula sp. GCM10025817]|uniref:protein kinase domain-containing protein n=1 Tax=Haloarcula TaxID=2237 RepID=UPI0023E8FC04|nr:serine/threonine protein kinase [Halomicroarcula sp. SYNS111]